MADEVLVDERTPGAWAAVFAQICGDAATQNELAARTAVVGWTLKASEFGVDPAQAREEARSFLRRAFPWRPAGWLDPVDILRARPRSVERVATGIPSIDTATRGGFPVGRVVIFQGAPGSCKTTLALAITGRAAIEGRAYVAAIMPDGGSDAAVLRLGQQLGLDEDKLSAGDDEALDELQDRLGSANFLFPPEDPDAMLLEAVAADLATAPTDLPRILLVDSVQTVYTGDARDQQTDRGRVQSVMRRLRGIAREMPCLVLGISQINRAQYRGKKEEENANPLAAGADSRAIEFDSDALYFLRGDPREGPVEFRSTQKNRIGRPVKIDLRLDEATATLAEIDAREVEDTVSREKTRAAEKASSKAQDAILRVIDKTVPRKGCPGLSETSLAGLVRLNKTRPAFRDALDALIDGQGVLEAVPGPRDGTYYRRRVHP